jgi:hypothetical protein
MLTLGQREHLKKYKIPVADYLTYAYYIVAIHEDSVMPTDIELDQLRSYTEFVIGHVYAEPYQKRIFEREFSGDSGHNTVILKKDEHGHWFFRRATWTEGPSFFPNVVAKEYIPMTLMDIFDREQRFAQQYWYEWKQTHSKIFNAYTT